MFKLFCCTHYYATLITCKLSMWQSDVITGEAHSI